MDKLAAFKKTGLFLSIIGISVGSYLPAVDNFFISDDFTLLALLKVLDQDPLYLLEAPSEFFRLLSYVYFWGLFKVFGLNPEPYYWSGIALHAIASLLVYALVMTVTRQSMAAWAAAVFFAAYERHQEAVMWISAANETILTLACLLFVLLWQRSTRLTFTLALAVFAMALFSKEAAVALAPLAVFSLILRGHSWRDALRRSAPLLLMTAAYISLWLSQAHRNFFVSDGHYALGLHFFPVYARGLVRLLSPTLLFLAPLLLLGRRGFMRDRSFAFFAALLALAVIPYSFLTYSSQIPSRNSYFPSVGVAGMIGILFMSLYRGLTSPRAQRLCIVFLLAVVSSNIAYIWVKKEPQYRARAAPTRQLIDILNGSDIGTLRQSPIYVCGFPLHPSIGSEAVAGFTRFTHDDVVFSNTCNYAGNNAVLHWDEKSERYTANFR